MQECVQLAIKLPKCLVRPIGKGLHLVPPHQSDRRATKQMAKRKVFFQPGRQIDGDYRLTKCVWLGHLLDEIAICATS